MESWLGVFKDEAEEKRIVNLRQLKKVIQEDDFGCVGTSHSYNGVQLYKGNLLDLRNSYLDQITYDEEDKTVTVEPSVSVRKLKEFLDKKNRQLYNSGNYMDQTVIGALITGTHGYGDNAVMAESISEISIIDKEGYVVTIDEYHPDFNFMAISFGVIQPIIKLKLKTKPISQYRITSCLCDISEIKFGGNIAFAVFPYSHDSDPICAITEIKELPTWLEPTKRPKDWGIFESIKGCLIKYYWLFDKRMPKLRKFVQKGIRKLKGSIQKDIITDPHDIDYLYDPYPLVEHDVSPILSRKIMKPTHTSYNLSFFCPQEICKEVLKFVIKEGSKVNPNGFRNFIGVRNINTPSNLKFSGNYKGVVSSIDLYSNPDDASFLWEIQKLVFDKFEGIRPHWGKSKLEPYIIEEFKEEFKILLKLRKKYCSENSTLHPSFEAILKDLTE